MRWFPGKLYSLELGHSLAFSYFRDVDAALTVNADAMPSDEGALTRPFVASPASDKASAQSPDAHPVATTLFDHVHNVVFYPHVTWPGEVCPFFEEIALVVEYLDAIILAVADYHPAVLVHPDVMQQGELSGASPLLTPREE